MTQLGFDGTEHINLDGNMFGVPDPVMHATLEWLNLHGIAPCKEIRFSHVERRPEARQIVIRHRATDSAGEWVYVGNEPLIETHVYDLEAEPAPFPPDAAGWGV